MPAVKNSGPRSKNPSGRRECEALTLERHNSVPWMLLIDFCRRALYHKVYCEPYTDLARSSGLQSWYGYFVLHHCVYAICRWSWCISGCRIINPRQSSCSSGACVAHSGKGTYVRIQTFLVLVWTSVRFTVYGPAFQSYSKSAFCLRMIFVGFGLRPCHNFFWCLIHCPFDKGQTIVQCYWRRL